MPKEMSLQAPSQVLALLSTRKEVPMIWHRIEIYTEGMDMERTPCGRTEGGSQGRSRTLGRMLAMAWPAGRILSQKEWKIPDNTDRPKKCFHNRRI